MRPVVSKFDKNGHNVTLSKGLVTPGVYTRCGIEPHKRKGKTTVFKLTTVHLHKKNRTVGSILLLILVHCTTWTTSLGLQ